MQRVGAEMSTRSSYDHPPMQDFAASLHRETAAELLTRVRRNVDPPGPTFISDLDEHISSAFNLTETESTLRRGDVIEIQGPAASGKTQLLYFFAMTCILPKVITTTCAMALRDREPGTPTPPREIELGGRGKAVAIMDCDGRWSMTRQHDIISSYVHARFTQAFEDVREYAETPLLQELEPVLEFEPDVTLIVRDCLERIHVFRPTSSMVLAATLTALPMYHQQKMQDQEILMLMIDSISAFHHADKWRIEEASLIPGGASKNAGRADLKPIAHVLSAIDTLRKKLGLVTFITNWALVGTDGRTVNNQKYDPSNPWYGQHLISPYPNIASADARPFPITHHITLPATELAVMPFPAGTSLAEALQDEERGGLVEEGRVTALVRTVGPNGMVTGSFEFGIKESSVSVE